LPYEAHGYTARESIEHVLYEMITWFDKYVRNAAPRNGRATESSRQYGQRHSKESRYVL
jgi:hypothetical protein